MFKQSKKILTIFCIIAMLISYLNVAVCATFTNGTYIEDAFAVTYAENGLEEFNCVGNKFTLVAKLIEFQYGSAGSITISVYEKDGLDIYMPIHVETIPADGQSHTICYAISTIPGRSMQMRIILNGDLAAATVRLVGRSYIN